MRQIPRVPARRDPRDSRRTSRPPVGPPDYAGRCSLLSWVVTNPAHPAPTMHQSLTEIFLDHIRRDAEPESDLLVAQTVPILQHDCRATFRRQLIQHFMQPLDALLAIDFASIGGQLRQLSLHRWLIDVDHFGPWCQSAAVLLCEVARNRVEVGLRIAY